MLKQPFGHLQLKNGVCAEKKKTFENRVRKVRKNGNRVLKVLAVVVFFFLYFFRPIMLLF